jgi:hypothetical protein
MPKWLLPSVARTLFPLRLSRSPWARVMLYHLKRGYCCQSGSVSHAPKRKDILVSNRRGEEAGPTPPSARTLRVERPALLPPKHHAVLAPEFAQELKEHGRIYMYRLRPAYPMHARPIDQYPRSANRPRPSC